MLGCKARSNFGFGSEAPNEARLPEAPQPGAMPENSIVAVHGDKKRRGCTDILFLIAFLAGIGYLFFVLHYSRVNGDMNKIIYGQDYMGDLCGQDNSIEATGVPAIVEVTVDAPAWRQQLPFVSSGDGNEAPTRILRGQRDHSDKPYLFYTLPLGSIDRYQSIAVCVERCPGVSGNVSEVAAEAGDPASWICTGRYSDGPPAACPGGLGDAAECVAYRGSFFLDVSNDVIAACMDPLSDCDICYPPYASMGLLTYCLPDPRHALEALEHVGTFVGAVEVAIGAMDTDEGAAAAAAAAAAAHNASSAAHNASIAVPHDLSVRDVEEMRQLVSSMPHLIYEDLAIAWPVIAGCVSMALVFSFLWLVLLRIFAGWMVWATLAAFVAGFAAGGFALWEAAEQMRADPRYELDGGFAQRADAAYYSFFGVAALGGLYVLVLLWLRRKIVIATCVIQEATKAVAALPLLLLLPLLMVPLCLLVLLCGFLLGLYLTSTGELLYGRQGFGHVQLSGYQETLLAATVFVAVWVGIFVRHLQHCVVAGAVSDWYFARDRWLDLGRFPVVDAARKALRYHAGTVALGSCVITLFKALRFALGFLQKKCKACVNSSNATLKVACCCVRCCLACFEKFLKYLSRNAYAQTMIAGTNFCASAARAVDLLSANITKVALVRGIGAAFLLLGKLFVAAASGGVGALVLLTRQPYKDELYSIGAPVAAIAAGGLVVAMACMGVYNMAIDTIFLCFCIDQERARNGQPTHCSESLAELIRTHGAEQPVKTVRGVPTEMVPVGIAVNEDSAQSQSGKPELSRGRSNQVNPRASDPSAQINGRI